MKFVFPFLLLFLSAPQHSQEYSLLRCVFADVMKISAMSDTAARNTELDRWWNDLIEHRRIPVAVEDSVIFFYRAEGKNSTMDGRLQRQKNG